MSYCTVLIGNQPWHSYALQKNISDEIPRYRRVHIRINQFITVVQVICYFIDGLREGLTSIVSRQCHKKEKCIQLIDLKFPDYFGIIPTKVARYPILIYAFKTHFLTNKANYAKCSFAKGFLENSSILHICLVYKIQVV